MPILRDNQLEIITRNPEHSYRVGQQLGAMLTAGDIVCLHGGLGAGKTTLTRGIGVGWGTKSRVTSPTYTLVNIYRRQSDQLPLYHVDAYRLEDGTDFDTVGFEDIFDGTGAVIIEWPQRIRNFIPNDYLWIDIDNNHENESYRVMTIQGEGDRYKHMVEALRQAIYGV